MLQSSPSIWAILLTLLVAVLGGGTVIGLVNLWINRGRPLVEKTLIGEQVDKAREETRNVRIQSELSLVKSAMDMVGRVEAELARKEAKIVELEGRLVQYDSIAREMKRKSDDNDI